MVHGVRFEERVREILRGKVSPEKSYGDNIAPSINNNITNQDATISTRKPKLGTDGTMT